MHQTPDFDSLHQVSIPRRSLLTRSLAAVAAAPAIAAATRLDALAQTGAPTLVGGAADEHSFEFVATVHQSAFEFDFYGYLTRVAGIESSLLFSTPDPANRDAASARLTFAGTLTGTSRSILKPVFDVNAEGTIGFYFNEAAGADATAPESFQAGAPIATGAARIQSIIVVTAPQTGLSTGFGDFEITTSAPFSIAESTFQFRTGEPRSRLTWIGAGQLLDPDLPESLVNVAGNSWIP